MGFTEDYIAAWNAKDTDTFVGQFAPDGSYTDVTMRLTYPGQAEIRRMFQSTLDSYRDYEFKHLNGTCDGRFYAVEWTHTSRSKLDGQEYTVRAVSVGDLDDQGRIIDNRDYWNPAHYPGGDPEHLTVEREAWAKLQK